MTQRSRLSRFLTLSLGVVSCGCLWLVGWVPAAWATTTLTWIDQPTADTSGYERAIAPRDWQFPADFGAHSDFQTEWWYYTGNVQTEDGRPFGFQFTVFRQAIAPPTADSDIPLSQVSYPARSTWRTPQIYSAHFTVSDVMRQRFYHQERFSRGSVGLAGAIADPYRVWIEDWSAAAVSDRTVRLQAATADVAIDLLVQQTRPPVLQGDHGLSQKGPEPGNASYYYSLVQQPTLGTITVQGHTYPVTGVTWKDHEYSTSGLSAGTVGWDWFSAQFDDDSALMLYRLRHEDGTPEATSAGKFVTASGDTLTLEPDDWTLTVKRTWQSPHSQATYPAAWHIQIPKADLEFDVIPQMADQELNTSTATYWEGAVSYQGNRHRQPLVGSGYVELTGYADRLDSLLAER